MRGVWQDKAAVAIVFLCTSSSVSHYCVQTRADVYSAETSKSTALGCNLVTSFSLLLPALLTSRPGPATLRAHWPTAAVNCLSSAPESGFWNKSAWEKKKGIPVRIVGLVGVLLIFQEIIA